MGQDIPFLPRLYVLRDSAPLRGIPEPQIWWIHTVIMLGRKLLVRQWKLVDLPPSSLWFTQLSIVAVYEELTYSMANQLDVYHDKWGKYIDLIT